MSNIIDTSAIIEGGRRRRAAAANEWGEKIDYATLNGKGKREKFGVFTYSDAERARAVATVKTSIDEQMAARAGEVSQIASIATRTSRASRRTSKLLGG